MTDHPPVTGYQIAQLRARLAFLTRDGARYRAVITNSDSHDGVALVCTSPDHPAGDKLAQLGVYDCCDSHVIETGHEKFAVFIVTAMAAIPALLDERDDHAAHLNRIRGFNDALIAANERLRAELADANRAIAELTGHGYEEPDPT
jgi:hypothetical protein